MLLIQVFLPLLLWIAACAGADLPVDPPTTPEAPTTPATPETPVVPSVPEPAGNHAPELRPEAPVYYFVTPVNIPVGGTHSTSSLLFGMIDPDGNPMTAAVDSTPLHGTLVIHADGTWSYTPNSGYIGGDRFFFSASDPWRKSASVEVAIVMNTAPLARADTLHVTAGDTLRFVPNDLLANDYDYNGFVIFPMVTDAPAHGHLLDDPTTPGQLLYIPAAGFTGTDEFHYFDEESEGDGAVSNTVTVTLRVQP